MCAVSETVLRLGLTSGAEGKAEADHSPPSSAEVKNMSRIRLHGMVLSQVQGQLYFLPWHVDWILTYENTNRLTA
jgi:hypothetical protein